MMNDDRLYTIDDAADFFQVSTKTVRGFIAEGTLKGFTAGRAYRFTKADLLAGVDALRKKQKKAGKPAKKQASEEEPAVA